MPWGLVELQPLLLGSLHLKPNKQGTQMASINLRLVMTCLLWTEGTSLWLHCCGWVGVDGGWGAICPGHSHVTAFGSHPRWFGVIGNLWTKNIFFKKLKERRQEHIWSCELEAKPYLWVVRKYFLWAHTPLIDKKYCMLSLIFYFIYNLYIYMSLSPYIYERERESLWIPSSRK